MLIVLTFVYDIKGSTKGKTTSYKVVLLLLVLLAGFRYRIGGDTMVYLYNYYHHYDSLEEITIDQLLSQSSSPLFELLIGFFKTIDARFYVFQLFHATVVNSLIFIYIKRHTPYVFSCVLFYFVWMYIYYNFEEMKASLSLVMCLFANDYMLSKKWVKSILLYVVGILFHYSAAVILITPLLFAFKINRSGMVILVACFLLGYVIQTSFMDYLFLLEFNEVVSSKASSYSALDVYFTQRLGLGGIVLQKLPWLFYALVAVRMLKRDFRSEMDSLKKIEPLVLVSLVFVFISIPLPIAYRYVHFYILYLVLYLSYIIVDSIRESRRLSYSVRLFRALLLLLPYMYIVQFDWNGTIYESTAVNKYYNYEKYIPYSSIFDKSLNSDRERLYKNLNSITVIPSRDEY